MQMRAEEESPAEGKRKLWQVAMNDESLTQKIIGCAMAVHRGLGPGFLESVYQKALAHELRKAGLKVACECPLQVIYDGVSVGDFAADIVVEDRILIENKAVQALCAAHEVQLVHYLTATRIEIGLLFNFGAGSLQFKRKSRTYSPKTASPADGNGNPVNPDKDSTGQARLLWRQE